MKLCLVTGCGRDVRTAGFCNMHYKRRLRTGSVGSPERMKGTHGEGTITAGGYREINRRGERKTEHTEIAERALGHRLPTGACVHHFDENRLNNAPTNLVICPSESYHRVLHMRQRALAACGNANYLKCPYCKAYDAPEALRHNRSGGYSFHPECHNKARRDRRAKLKELSQ